MNAMLEPRIVAANTHGPAFLTQDASALVDLMYSSSHGCISALLIFSTSAFQHFSTSAFCSR